MPKCYLDSNVLIFLKDSSSIFHQQSVKKLDWLLEKDYSIIISPLVLDEFLYVFRYGLLKQKAANLFDQLRKAVGEIMELPNLSIVSLPTEAAIQLKVIDFMEKYGLNPRDAYHLLVMKENDIQYFATFDNDFNKVFADKLLKSI